MIDNQQTSFTLSIICCEGESRFSSFCKITSTARKAGKQIAQTDGLLITGYIKAQIHYLLEDFKVGLILNVGFLQIRENPPQSAIVWAPLWKTQKDRFDVISSAWFLNFSKDMCRHSFLCFIYEITVYNWLVSHPSHTFPVPQKTGCSLSCGKCALWWVCSVADIYKAMWSSNNLLLRALPFILLWFSYLTLWKPVRLLSGLLTLLIMI